MSSVGRLVLAALSGVLLLALFVRVLRLEPVSVAGGSMLPSLPPGTRLALRRGALPRRRGQVVVVRPAGQGLLVKRVVGLPGERVRLDELGFLRVDGVAVQERCGRPAPGGGTLDLRLGPGEYAVLGDRRWASTDSRRFGPVTAAELLGVVPTAYWPPRVLWRQLTGRS